MPVLRQLVADLEQGALGVQQGQLQGEGGAFVDGLLTRGCIHLQR